MIVTATGAHSSGTRLLTRILNAGPFEARHQSLPGAGVSEPSVIIHRDPLINAYSMVRNGHAKSLSEAVRLVVQAREELAVLDAPVVFYRRLVQDPQPEIDRIAEWYDVDPWTYEGEIFDGDAYYHGGSLSVDKKQRLFGDTDAVVAWAPTVRIGLKKR